MPVTQADLKLKRSEVVGSDSTTNGGHMTTTAIGTTLFPDVTGSERSAGITRWRKVFFKNEAGTGTLPEREADPLLSLVDARMFLLNTSAAEDYFLMKAAVEKVGVQDDESDTGWSGAGELVSDIAQDDTTLDVTCEINGSAGEIFQDGGTVLIVSGATREAVVLDNPGGVSWVANVATLTFTATPLQHDYTAVYSDTADIFTDNTIGTTGAGWTVNEHVGRRVRTTGGTGSGQRRRVVSNTTDTLVLEYGWSDAIAGDTTYEIDLTAVCQCVDLGTIECSVSTPVVTSAAGTFTPGITLYPIGTVDDDWTLLMSGSPVDAYTITGTKSGAQGVFPIVDDAQPTNGASFYFKVDATAFGGTFLAGDTITFSTVSAAAAVWIKQTVPAGSAAYLANSVDIGASGDTL